MNSYIVTKQDARAPLTIRAKTSDQAKRIACRIHGCRPSDYWCGISAYQTRKVKEVAS